MPIYAYRCTTCGHAQDVLQKMSDPLLTVCPNCGNATYQKQVTAAGFQLKGSGWYVTDFRGDKSTATPPPKGGDESGDGSAKGNENKAADASASAPSGDGKMGDGKRGEASKGEASRGEANRGEKSDKSSSAPAPAPAASAAPAPSPAVAPKSAKPDS